MERFLDEVGLDNVKATIDISHMWLTRTPPGEIARRMRGRVAHVHMSDCDGTNHGDLPPGRGNTPFAEYLGAIRDTGFSGAVSIELEFPPDPAKDAFLGRGGVRHLAENPGRCRRPPRPPRDPCVGTASTPALRHASPQ